MIGLSFCFLGGVAFGGGQLTAGMPVQAPEERTDNGDELRRHDVPVGVETGPPSEVISWLLDGAGQDRLAWSRRGYTLSAYLTLDASSHMSGGADPGSAAARGLLDASLDIDGGKAIGLESSRFVLGLQAFGGDNGSADVGLIQSYSNIDAADDRVQLGRAWYEQGWSDDATRVRIGKMDANGLFASVAGAARFIHPSMALSPTILGIPTYPDSAFGIAVQQQLGGGFDVRLGLFDGAAQAGVRTGIHGPGSVFGAPSDLFYVAESSYSWAESGAHAGRAALGRWQHTGDFDRFDGGSERGTGGFFLVLEQRLGEDSKGRSTDAFLQLGEADDEVSSIQFHIGLGVTASNFLLPEREDAIGVGLSQVRLSDTTGAGFTAEAETAIETFWSLKLSPGIRAKPDLQYIIDPGGDGSQRDAWIATLRITLSL